jgi:hypothetical protein
MSMPDDPGPGFGPWLPLEPTSVDAEAPDVPAAVQLRRADRQLVAYPRGRSAMVFYFYAARSAREALKRLFRDELVEPGARGEGPLEFRCSTGGEAVQRRLETLYDRFVEEFGRAPILHADEDDDG